MYKTTVKVLFQYLVLLSFIGQAQTIRAASLQILSIHCLGQALIPLSINNRSDILVQDEKLGNLAILRDGKYSAIGIKSRNCGMNDSDTILIDDNSGGQSLIWIKGHRYDLNLPPNYFVSGPCINNNKEVPIESELGDVGFIKNGKVTLLFNSIPSYHIHVNYMNDKHQVLGIIQGPFITSSFGKAKLHFTSRPFLWDKGKFRYLKSPSTGFCYPTAVNNTGQIVGEYRPNNGSLQRNAVVWMNSTAPMIDLNSLMIHAKTWHLSSAFRINDKQQIIGSGENNGKNCHFLCTLQSVRTK